MQKKWLVKDAPDVDVVRKLKKELNVSEIVAYMLVQRGITEFDDAKHFFRGSLNKLHDPHLMKDMDRAVERVSKAIENSEKIMIYGDYDVDGTTAVSLVYSFLKHHTNKIEYYIPDRYKEGYGLSKVGIEYAAESGCSLLISLDCGIKAIDQVDLANNLGLDVIVCDHHTPGKNLPDCIVLDPKRNDCDYPYKELSGCGVGYKLMTAVAKRNDFSLDLLNKNLDLLAISIGADIVPITGENRLLCQHGLEQLNKNTRVGIEKMLNLAKKEKPLSLTNVVFIIAPRINAAGRMGDAKNAVKLLTSENMEEVRTIAKAIHEDNENRRAIDKVITAEALEILENDENFDDKCTNVVYKSGWHKGVIGIVASRIIETYYRPTVVLTQIEEGENWTGSVRSIKGVNVYDILEKCSDVLEQFGGHYYAAGLTVKTENLALFTEKFDKEVKKVINSETLIPEQILESEISFETIFNEGESVHEVPRLKRILKQFEPHGPENMKPVFLAKNVYAMDANLLKGEHLKMKVYQPKHNKPIDAIMFSSPDSFQIVNESPFDMVFTLEENNFRGRSTLQLNVKDLRPSMALDEKVDV
ncbi:MAG: single-stranded-DNA-specific exonuclease RecJ [Brumimicrobium sp.]